MQQLSLRLDFKNPSPDVLRTLATLVELSDLVATTQESDLPSPSHQDGRQYDSLSPKLCDGYKIMRKAMRKLVGCIVLAQKKEWPDVWVQAYHKFFEATNRHPVVESGRLGLPAHLDYIFTDPSWPGLFHRILEEMLTGKVAA